LEELQKTLEEVLEGEKTKPLKDRLEVQFDAPKQKVLGEEATHQSRRLLRISRAVPGLHTSPERCVSGGESVYGNGRGR
jgi:hypothetical protein